MATVIATTSGDMSRDDDATPRRIGLKRGPKPGTEGARRGGEAVRAKYGREFFSRIGSKGGKAAKAVLGADGYAAIGQQGGSATRDKLGHEHYQRIGRMGGLRVKQRRARGEVIDDIAGVA